MTALDLRHIAIRRAQYLAMHADVTCGCGAKYAPTNDGRLRHQLVVGHRPSLRVPTVPMSLACDAGLCRRCREACACGCHLAGGQG